MPIGYKYAERDADSQVNWAEVGKGLSDMLAETNRIRQEKKDAIDAATREEQNNLANAPQGQDQDLNNFTNKFAHNAMEQSLIDEKLLKSGQMPLEKYTLRRQNRVDGTNTLFSLSKLYQDEFKTKMEGVTSGELQALNIFNMSTLEGVANFNNSEAVIDSLGDGRVNIGLYETKTIDGKEVRVLSKNIAPVNVWKNRILQNIPTFDVEAETTATVEGFGTRKDVLYKAATLSGAGSITELMGPDFLATNPDPTTQKIVNDMNDAIDKQIDSYFSNPYNLTSVLTQNTGKYGSDSFTFDKDEADKDPNKILLKINPTTQMGEMDEDGPNYKTQKEEATNWVRTNMLSKIDQERNIKTTSQNQLQETEEQRQRAIDKYRPKTGEDTKPEDAASMLGMLWYGDNNQVKSAIDYFKGFKDKDGFVLFEEIVRDGNGITVTLPDGTKESVSFVDENGTPRTQEDFIRSAGPLLAGQIDINSALENGSYEKDAKFNKESKGVGATIKKFELSADTVSDSSQRAYEKIQTELPEGFTAEDTGSINPLNKAAMNQVTITAPNGKKYNVKTRLSGDDAKNAAAAVSKFVIDNSPKQTTGNSSNKQSGNNLNATKRKGK